MSQSNSGHKRYRTLVVDPPWAVDQHSRAATTSRRLPPYEVMMLDAIRRLPISDLADDDAHLYLWTVNTYVEQAYDIARAWGFTPSTLLVWCKPPMGVAYGGAYSISTEFCLFARRGRGAYEQRHPTTWWNWPRTAHSAKPEAFLDMVERVSPAPRAELFARRARFGWDYPIGNQSLGGTAVGLCSRCRRPLTAARVGRRRRYCSDACRAAASRNRRRVS